MSDASGKGRIGRPLKLDARELLSYVSALGEDRLCNLSYVIRDGRLRFRDLEATPRKAFITVNINWPAAGERVATGFIWISDEKWDLHRLVIPFTGKLTRAGIWMWRLICPVTKKPVQRLYLDRDAEFFVSREALGRRPRTNPARIARIISQLGEASDPVGGICDDWSLQKPPHMSDVIFSLVEKAFEIQFYRLHFALSALPEPCFNTDGSMYLERLVRRDQRTSY